MVNCQGDLGGDHGSSSPIHSSCSYSGIHRLSPPALLRPQSTLAKLRAVGHLKPSPSLGYVLHPYSYMDGPGLVWRRPPPNPVLSHPSLYSDSYSAPTAFRLESLSATVFQQGTGAFSVSGEVRPLLVSCRGTLAPSRDLCLWLVWTSGSPHHRDCSRGHPLFHCWNNLASKSAPISNGHSS